LLHLKSITRQNIIAKVHERLETESNKTSGAVSGKKKTAQNDKHSGIESSSGVFQVPMKVRTDLAIQVVS
jgi:hypothetical protein